MLGVESVPDGLATGLLAGVNPLAGLYGYMVGTVAGALATSSAFMAVQGTGAMAILVADVNAVHDATDPARALYTLSMLTGVVMVVAGLLKLGSVLRFVSNAVMVGFINAVGVNIVLGQLANLTGYNSPRDSRLTRALDTVLHPGRLDGQSVAIGLGTMVLIIVLERTRLGSLGLVVGVVVTSAAANALGWNVATVHDLGATLGSLPDAVLPELRLVPALIVPAVSLALVGLVQGAGISANFPNDDGSYPDPSRDFIGQGIANIASGALEGMPVGGSVSASSLNKAAGARTRTSLVVAGVVMAVILVAFGDAIGNIAMPALAGLLILVGIRTIKPSDLRLGLENRRRAADRVGDDVRAHDGHPVAVRRRRRRRTLGRALCRRPVEPRHPQAADLHRGRAHHRDRSARPSARPTTSSSSSPTAACSSPPPRSSRQRFPR